MHDLDRMLQLQLEGKSEEARAISDKLQELGSDKIVDAAGNNTSDIWLRHCFNRGWFLIQEGKYQEGSQLLESGRFLNVYGNPPVKTKAKIFNPAEHDLVGKTIVLSLEGGYGDEIIHARFATSYKNLGAGKVYIASSPELASLFSRIDGVDGVISRLEIDSVEPDYWVPGFSAGWVAGHTFEDFPNQAYLKANPESTQIWTTFVGETNKPRIGIRWAGNPKFEHQQFRRFPPSFLTNIHKHHEDLEIFSFQRDHNTVSLPEHINDLQHTLISWEDTAAAIENMDLVITSCTSIAHLAGALGKETWVIVPLLPYHTWTWEAPHSTTTPYYSNVRVFRQKTFGKWNDVFQELYAALEEKYQTRHIKMPNEDKEQKKLLINCGPNKEVGYHCVDARVAVLPDEVYDISNLPLPWKDNEYSHIVVNDILQTIGKTQDDVVDVIEELYRISDNGAIWEITVPHPRHDKAFGLGNKHVLSMDFFLALDQRHCMDEKLAKGINWSLEFAKRGIDLSLANVDNKITGFWQAQFAEEGAPTQEQLNHILSTYNNVASDVLYTLQVHKPGRYKAEEYDEVLGKLAQTK